MAQLSGSSGTRRRFALELESDPDFAGHHIFFVPSRKSETPDLILDKRRKGGGGVWQGLIDWLVTFFFLQQVHRLALAAGLWRHDHTPFVKEQDPRYLNIFLIFFTIYYFYKMFCSILENFSAFIRGRFVFRNVPFPKKNYIVRCVLGNYLLKLTSGK